MGGITKLPAELIQHIFDQLSTLSAEPSYSHLDCPDDGFKEELSDLGALSRTCQAFEQLVGRNLFNYVELTEPRHNYRMSLIRGWASRPDCTQHVRRVCIPIYSLEQVLHYGDMRLSEDNISFINETFGKMGLKIYPPRWEDSSHINILSMTIPLMANFLRKLEIQYIWNEYHDSHDVSGKFFGTEDDIFPNLHTLYIKCTHHRGQFPMEFVASISKIAPKLRSLKIHNFNTAWFDGSHTWEKLTSLSIWQTLLMQPGLAEMISKPKHLFHFDHDSSDTSVDYMVGMIDALAEHKETLKSLSVIFPRRLPGEAASLQFHKLRNLDTFTTRLQDEHLRRLEKTGKYRDLQVFVSDNWEERDGEQQIDFDGRDEDSIEKGYLAEAIDWLYLMS
ncbi:hypothetical protein CSAL01_12299 [Colletotrichum salicis]|uniref:F-box domain-containing protein n=1 Tax=Colletotrichum salicis TaxID=1209931 RepID=A0A135U7X5_9PEZI|nr:hypothetical protein CSAL01_12299 [Colletotrichum salicis]